MNIFRLTGDLLHLIAIIILLQKIWHTRSCVGISGKSQILFALVYTTRYLDLVTSYVSPYNTSMKCVFIATSYTTIYLIYLKFKATYDRNHDTFRIEFLIVPAFALALLIHHEFTTLEILWTFSIYLEAVAILPQLFMVIKTGEAESITSHKPALFTSALGEISTAPPNCNSIPHEKKQLVYACGAPFYPAPCADAQPRPTLTGEAESITSLHYLFALGSYRAFYILNWVYRYTTNGQYDLIAIVAGVVQTAIYCDFFCWYITEVRKGKKLQLPA